MQDIDREITEKYKLNINSISPFKDTYIISSNAGRKVLKKTGFSPDRIEFVHGAKEHLYNNGFTSLDRFMCTEDGRPYIDINGDIYTMTDIAEGKECNFSNKDDIIKASRALALLHKASKGYMPMPGVKTRDDLDRLPLYFGKRLEEIKKLKKIARRGKGKFDYMFLQYVDHFYDLGESTLEQLINSNYSHLCEYTRKEGSFCHHDFTHNNIICSNSRTTVINFDYCCFELKVYDIANLIRRKMRKCDWNINEACIIVKEYQDIEKLTDDDFEVMKLILQFPQKFWRVVNRFYNSKRSWSERSFISKLQEVIDEIEPHRKFMEEYDILVE